MLVPNEVIVDVGVHQVARVHGILVCGSWHVPHNGRAVDGSSYVRVHACHGHLLVLHSDGSVGRAQ